MQRSAAIAVAAAAALCAAVPAYASPANSSVAALQVALRAHGEYRAPVDGVSGPLTKAGLLTFKRTAGVRERGLGRETRRALGRLGRPLLGQRELNVGAIGWDVSSLEFRLVEFGLAPSAVDGRFTPETAVALRAFQRARGLIADGLAGPRTYRALARGEARPAKRPAVRTHVVRAGEGFYAVASRYHVDPAALARRNRLRLTSLLVPGQRLLLPAGARVSAAKPAGARTAPAAAALVYVVRPGEGFYAIAARWGVSPWELTRVNGLSLSSVLQPGQRLTLPVGARPTGTLGPTTKDEVIAAIDRWSAAYGVDSRLARALAWMESGFQPDVVSNVGAIGVMQLLPETWAWVDETLIGARTPRTYEGNVQVGVRYLRWQLDHFRGDVRLALAGYYQGARAVRERGLFDDTKQYVSVIRQLYGSV
jgi:soluble lytic murein transglycosylase-like protein